MNFPDLPVKVALSVAESVVTNTYNGSTNMMSEEKAFTILLEELCKSKQHETVLEQQITDLQNQINMLRVTVEIKESIISELTDNKLFLRFI